jgi:fluoroquinolone resistance protein
MNDGSVAYYNKVFKGLDDEPTSFENGIFEQCTFEGLQIHRIDFRQSNLIECTFKDCDLSNAYLHKSTWQGVYFSQCKMIGMRFDTIDPFGFQIQLKACVLDLSVFTGRKLNKTIFESSRFREVDFLGCDLRGAKFIACQLEGAVFAGCNLQKADFTTSRGYVIDPNENQIAQAKFDLYGLPGLLEGYAIEVQMPHET